LFAKDISKTVAFSFRLMAKDKRHPNKLGFSNRTLLEDTNPAYSLPVKKKRAFVWPPARY
jgi:hypothetical protein